MKERFFSCFFFIFYFLSPSSFQAYIVPKYICGSRVVRTMCENGGRLEMKLSQNILLVTGALGTNNNNGYFERLTCTGPKHLNRLQSLLSRFCSAFCKNIFFGFERLFEQQGFLRGMDFNVPYTEVSQKTYTLVPSSSGLHWDMAVGLVEVLFYVHRNRRLIRDGSPGRPPRLSHSSWALPLGVQDRAYIVPVSYTHLTLPTMAVV